MGNIEQIADAHASETSSFAYDGLNRLTNWALTGGTPEEYAYNATTGNLETKAGVTYTYNSGHAHGVSSLSDGSSYQYDANGNMTQRVVGGQTFNFGYDAENRLVSVSGAMMASFVYDGDGNRVKSTIGGTTTYFVGNIYESTDGVATKYYYAGAQRIAMRVGTGDPYYLLSDHLGSTTVTTDASGGLVSELRYKPWGEARDATGTTPTDYTFTGQYSNVSDFGLMFYNARWYDPALGRFAQADSIVPPGAQGWDRYAYVNNNPVNFTDPSGHCIWDLCILEGVGIVETVAVVGGALIVFDFYRRHAPPDALTSMFESISDQVGGVAGALRETMSNEMRGEYVPPGMSREQRDSYRDALHRYKERWHVPPNTNVPKGILDEIADSIKKGANSRDAARNAPRPPESLERRGRPKPDSRTGRPHGEQED